MLITFTKKSTIFIVCSIVIRINNKKNITQTHTRTRTYTHTRTHARTHARTHVCTDTHKSHRHDITELITNIASQTSTELDYPCCKLASSVGRASEQKFEGRGFISHVIMNLYLRLKNLSTTLNLMNIP